MQKLQYAVAIDFDGCLCKDKYPEIGEPNWNVIYLAKAYKKQGASYGRFAFKWKGDVE